MVQQLRVRLLFNPQHPRGLAAVCASSSNSLMPSPHFCGHCVVHTWCTDVCSGKTHKQVPKPLFLPTLKNRSPWRSLFEKMVLKLGSRTVVEECRQAGRQAGEHGWA